MKRPPHAFISSSCPTLAGNSLRHVSRSMASFLVDLGDLANLKGGDPVVLDVTHGF